MGDKDGDLLAQSDSGRQLTFAGRVAENRARMIGIEILMFSPSKLPHHPDMATTRMNTYHPSRYLEMHGGASLKPTGAQLLSLS